MDSVGPGGMLLDAMQLRHGEVQTSFIFAYVETFGAGERARNILEECQHSMNIYSPFERVRTVLQHITQAEGSKDR